MCGSAASRRTVRNRRLVSRHRVDMALRRRAPGSREQNAGVYESGCVRPLRVASIGKEIVQVVVDGPHRPGTRTCAYRHRSAPCSRATQRARSQVSAVRPPSRTWTARTRFPVAGCMGGTPRRARARSLNRARTRVERKAKGTYSALCTRSLLLHTFAAVGVVQPRRETRAKHSAAPGRRSERRDPSAP